MALSPQEWHDRFLVQASWSRELRSYFFQEARAGSFSRILDIGCGTGALFSDLKTLKGATVFGADINLDYLSLESASDQQVHLSGADVHHLPFPDQSFDLVLCHYFLMWTGSPQRAIAEMRRVTRQGGLVAAFAEPDYGGRIDFPIEFIKLKDLQINALVQAGADPRMGRKLRSLFSNELFTELAWGVYQGSWQNEPSPDEIKSEWLVLRDDLSGQLTGREIDALQEHDSRARRSGTRMAYVPTFYCWGKAA